MPCRPAVRRASRVRAVALLMLATVAAVVPSPPASAAPEAWEQPVVDLASADPKVRIGAAKRLGEAWPEGALAALVLAEVAIQDADASVRDAARSAVESMGVRALRHWAGFLEAAKGGQPKAFHEAAKELELLGHSRTNTDLLAGVLSWSLASEPQDVTQAAVLALVPFLLGDGPSQLEVARRGADLLLVDRLRAGAPLTREMAAAGLATLANALLREARPDGPGEGYAKDADLRALEAGLADERPGLARWAVCVLGAVGPARPEVVARLASLVERVVGDAEAAPETRPASADPALVALARYGTRAQAALEAAVRAADFGLRGAVYAQARLGSRSIRLLDAPQELLDVLADPENRTPSRDLIEGLASAAMDAGALAAADAVQAQPYVAPLWAMAKQALAWRDGHPAAAQVLAASLRALAELGPLDAQAEAFLAPLLQEESGSVAPAAWMLLLRQSPRPGPQLAGLLPELRRFLASPRNLGAGRAAGRNLGLSGPVPELSLTGDAVPAELRIGVLRGYAEARTADAARVAQALAALASTSERAAVLGTGKIVASFADLPLHAGDAPLPPSLAQVFELRLAAVEALGAFGPAAKSAVPALTALRSDPDPRLRWRVERALRLILSG